MALERELKFYESIKDQLLQHYEGKFVIIEGEEQLGVFDQPEEAYAFGIETIGNVPMLIKQVVSQEPVELIPALALRFVNADT